MRFRCKHCSALYIVAPTYCTCGGLKFTPVYREPSRKKYRHGTQADKASLTLFVFIFVLVMLTFLIIT